MSKARSRAPTHQLGMAKEFFTAATLPALSNALVDRGIDPYAILAIEIARLAGARRPQFRVLYEGR